MPPSPPHHRRPEPAAAARENLVRSSRRRRTGVQFQENVTNSLTNAAAKSDAPPEQTIDPGEPPDVRPISWRSPMAYVVTAPCFGCKYTDCVTVCPCDCFHEGDQMLYIDPD